jgi:hypothetical protein
MKELFLRGISLSQKLSVVYPFRDKSQVGTRTGTSVQKLSVVSRSGYNEVYPDRAKVFLLHLYTLYFVFTSYFLLPHRTT